MEVPVKRVNEYKPFEKAILRDLWPQVEQTPKDGKQRRFTGTYKLQEATYDIICDYMLTADFLRVFKLEASLDGKVVYTSEPLKELPPITQEFYM